VPNNSTLPLFYFRGPGEKQKILKIFIKIFLPANIKFPFLRFLTASSLFSSFYTHKNNLQQQG